jgi:hypothetical protein
MNEYIKEKYILRLSMVVHSCNLSYSGGEGRRITVQDPPKLAWTKDTKML